MSAGGFLPAPTVRLAAMAGKSLFPYRPGLFGRPTTDGLNQSAPRSSEERAPGGPRGGHGIARKGLTVALATGETVAPNYVFGTADEDTAKDIVCRFHYSGRPPANVQCVGVLMEPGGLFGDRGDVVAACFFSIPPTRWKEAVWELSRLVRTNAPVPLTALISRTCALAKGKGADLLVSFADATQGHHGGIYQAASWHYAGKRGRQMDGCIVDGVFIPGRSCNSRWGTRSPQKLSAKLGREVVGHYDEGKHLYWRPLNRAGKRKAQRLGLKSLPYPKPERNEEFPPDASPVAPGSAGPTAGRPCGASSPP